MQTYDIIMLVILVAATAYGAWKGLAWQVASVASLVASYFLSVQFRGNMASFIKADPPWNTFLGMLLVYVCSSACIWLAFSFVSGVIDRVRLKEFDRQIGALVGFAKGVLLCVIVTLFAVTLSSHEQRQQIVNSRSGRYISQLIDKSHGVMPEEVHKVLNPYLTALEKGLENGPANPAANTERAAGIPDVFPRR